MSNAFALLTYKTRKSQKGRSFSAAIIAQFVFSFVAAEPAALVELQAAALGQHIF